MAKTKEQNKEIIVNLADKISQAKSIFFTKFDALGVKDNEELRKQLKNEGSEYYVVKKTLLDLAFRDKKIANLNVKNFIGRVAVIFGYTDEVMPAKIVDKFKKNRKEKIEFIGGIFEDKFIDSARVAELAKLPSKQELYAKLVGSINAPVSGLVNVLAGNMRNLVYVLKTIENKKDNN